MKRFTIGMLFVLFTSVAAADWVDLGTTSEGTTLYLDPTTERWTGHFVEIWAMYDKATPELSEGSSILSIKDLYQIDCSNRTYRIAFQVLFTGRKGAGSVAKTTKASTVNWEPISPKSMINTISYVLCKRKP